MKIAVNNIDKKLRVELSRISKIVDINSSPRGVFIEWVADGDLFEKQTIIIDKCVKEKIPMIVFDRYQKILPEEISFLVSQGAFLWEPSVAGRMFFSYQPCWGYFRKSGDIPLIDKIDGIDLVYMSSLSKKISTFQKYYKPVSDIGDFKVVYVDKDNNDVVNRKVSEMGIDIIGRDDKISKKSVILLGTEHEYQTGILDPQLFDYLEAGILPLLPKEHRWFHSIFDDVVINNESDVDYFLKTWDKISFGVICDIYEKLNLYLPESDVKNVAKRIIKYFS